jgi:hypothetical protein
MIETYVIKIRGLSPLLHHRYGGEQPTQPKPRVKTQAWIDSMHKKDWTTSAYWDEQIGFHVPGDSVSAMLAEGAKRMRKKPTFETFSECQEFMLPLIYYRSPEDKEGVYLKGNLEDYYVREHIDLRRSVIPSTGASVDRCRPVFKHWGLEFTVNIENRFLSLADLQSAMEWGCLCDFRPRFGRFAVEKIEQRKARKTA